MSGPGAELWIPLGYLALVLTVGLLSARKTSRSVTGYVAGDRAMNVLVLYFVLGAAIFSSFAFLGAPGWAYSRGAAAYFILVYGALGLVPMYFLGPRARRLGQRFGFVTQAEMLAHRFRSPVLSVVMAVLSIVIFIPYLVLQMKGAGFILEVVSGGRIPIWAGALLTYTVVTVYVFHSGVMGVGWTSMLQGIFMMVLAWGLGLYLPQALFGGVEEMFRALDSEGFREALTPPGLMGDGRPWHWPGFASAVLVTALGFSCWPHFFMKAFAARSDRAIRMTVVMYPSFQIFLIPILLIGFAGILAYPGVSPADTILPHVLINASLPAWIVGIACAGTLAASMSSGDAILHAAASIGVRDGVRPLRDEPLSDAVERRVIRWLVLVMASVSYYFAVWSTVPLVDLLVGAYGAVAQIMPLMLAALYWRRATPAGAIGGLLGGLAVNTLFLVFPELRPWPVHEGVYGLATNVALLVGISLAGRPMAEGHVGEYFRAMGSGRVARASDA